MFVNMKASLSIFLVQLIHIMGCVGIFFTFSKVVVWQLLIITSQLLISACQSSSDDINLNNPFASIEPSTDLDWTSCNYPIAAAQGVSTPEFTTECARFLVCFKPTVVIVQ